MTQTDPPIPSLLTSSVTLPAISVQLYQAVFSPKKGYVREKRSFISAVLDSGSNINCLSRKLAAEAGFIATEDGTTFRTSNGQSSRTRGSCRLGLFKDSRTRVMDLQFQIVDDLPVPVLLGLGFLQHVVLDMPARTVTLKFEGKEVVWVIEDECGEELLSSVVKARKDLMVEAQRREEKVLEAKLFGTELPGGVPLCSTIDRDALEDFKQSALMSGRHDHAGDVLVSELVEEPDGKNIEHGTTPDAEELKEVLDGLCPEDDAWKNIKFQSELSDSQQQRFNRIIEENRKVFQSPKSPQESLFRGANARPLDVKLCSNQYSRPKKLPTIPLQLKDSWDKQLAKWEAEGIVEQQTKAVPFLSAFVPVPKKDGSIRWTFDTRSVNRMIEWENVALPPVESVVAKMSRFKYVTAIDFLSFYLSFPVTEATADLLTFIDPSTSRSMKFRRSIFGLRGSASHSVLMTNEVLSKLPFFNDRMSTYIDDVFVGSDSVEQVLDDLKKILELIKPTNLRLKPSKCKIGQTKSVIFGYDVKQGEYRISQDRIKALINLPSPKTKKDLQKYFGSFSYFRASLPFNSSMAYHQTQFADLLKKDNLFVWNDEYQKKFDDLKLALSHSVTRTAPIPGEQLNMRCDSSKHYVGFVLSVTRPEGEKIVMTGSRKWPPRFVKYDACRLELLGVLTSLRMLRHMLIGHMVAIWTDNPYTFFILRNRRQVLIEEPQIISRLLNEVSRLNFQIHKASNNNPEWHIVDMLSRAGHKWIISHRNIDEILSPSTSMDVTMLSSVSQYDVEEVSFTTFTTQAVLKDLLEFKKVVAKIHDSESYKANGTVPDDLQDEVIARTHALAHLGSPRVIAVLNQVNIHFENRRSKVADFIRRCHICSTTKCNNRPLNVQGAVYNSSRPGDIIAFDINSVGLGANAIHILMAVDQHTEYCMPYKLPPVPSAVNVLRSALLHLVRFAPCCHTIRVDNGAVFKARIFVDTMTDLGIKVSFTSRLNSRSNSLVERKNKELNSNLRLMRSVPSGRHFDLDLAVCALKINMVPHSKYKISPYELFHGVNIIANQGDNFNSPEEALLRIQKLEGLREVVGIFKGHPIPNSVRFVDIDDIVRLATVQKVGSNKIQRLAFTEAIYRVTDADHQRQTFKVMELGDNGEIKDPESKPIITHLRHIRLVQKCPKRLKVEQENRFKPSDRDEIDDLGVNFEVAAGNGDVTKNTVSAVNPVNGQSDINADNVSEVTVGDSDAQGDGQKRRSSESRESKDERAARNINIKKDQQDHVIDDVAGKGSVDCQAVNPSAADVDSKGPRRSSRNRQKSSKYRKGGQPQRKTGNTGAVKKFSIKKNQGDLVTGNVVDESSANCPDARHPDVGKDASGPRRSSRNRRIVKHRQEDQVHKETKNTVAVKNIVKKVQKNRVANKPIDHDGEDCQAVDGDEDHVGPRRSARIQQATKTHKANHKQNKDHYDGTDGDDCAVPTSQGRKAGGKGSNCRQTKQKSKKYNNSPVKRRRKCQLCLMVECHRGCILGPE